MTKRSIVTAVIALAIVLLAIGIFRLTLEIDEVADCRLKQWMAGGKTPPELDLASNIAFEARDGEIVADFRKLAPVWSHICLTTNYQPGSPYVIDGGHGPVGRLSDRGIGCWRGPDPSNLTIALTHRTTGESQYFKVSVPDAMRTHPRTKVALETNYAAPQLSSGRQCTDTTTAVANCHRGPHSDPTYCLLVFR